MKKRIAAVLCLVLVALMALSTVSFAEDGGLKVVRTTPKNGAENTTKDNMCVKVYFNHAVGNKASEKANKGKFKITTAKGKKLPTLIYYNDSNPKYAIILIDTTKVNQKTIKDDTTYVCTIDADFQDNDGNTLGKDVKIKFKTMNQGRSTKIYMVMMVIMMVLMMVFTMKSTMNPDAPEEAKKKKQSEAGKEKKFNPYKEAKKTGKSVEEVVAEHEKEVEKEEKKAARRLKKEEKELLSPEEQRRDGDAYRVHRRQPISKAGSTYKTGRKAIADAEAAKRAEEKARRKATNYGKNPEPKKKRNR